MRSWTDSGTSSGHERPRGMNLLATGALLILAGCLGAGILRRQARAADRVMALLVTAGCACAAAAALRALGGVPGEAWRMTPTLPGGAWELGLDGLSAWFVLLLALAGGGASLYAISYMEAERAHRPVATLQLLWGLLLVSMLAVLAARSAVLFLLCWEVMALSAYFLILFEHERPEVRRAGLIYLILTHVGSLALLLMFLMWGRHASELTFGGLAAVGAALPWGGAVVLLLALLGFGLKAGLFPFHFWLPGAHAAAPSPVSALMSGVMLKMGIYGLFRVVLLLGAPPAWWGWLTLCLGLASALLGVLWALAQHDLKRVLAYSSVENIGIVMMGFGLGGLGAAYHRPLVAWLGYTAALLHTLNHALFKSLLFLGAGSIVRGAGTREIDRLGGLARRMPGTAVVFAIGAVAIAGLPPLNGFVGEWILVQGFLNTAAGGDWLRFACLAGPGVALIGALVLACFVRLYGALMLGQPRDASRPVAVEANRGMLLPMYFLALACVALGLLPGPAVRAAMGVARVFITPGGTLVPPEWIGDWGMRGIPLLGGVLIALGLLTYLARRMAGKPEGGRSAPTWGCGFARPTSRMQYTASSFAAPLANAFSAAVPLTRVRTPGGFRTVSQDRVLRQLMQPLWNQIQSVALTVRPLQQGRIRTYLSYIIGTLVLLLAFLYFFAAGGHN